MGAHPIGSNRQDVYTRLWKRGRAVEGTGLENRRGATHREFESHRFRFLLSSLRGGMADAGDLKSSSRKGVWVRLPPRAPL